MEVRDISRNIYRTWLVLIPVFGQAMALSDIDLKAILGTIIPVAIILMIVAIIFIIRYYKKYKEIQKKRERLDAQNMIAMRDKYARQSPQSGISSTAVPEILVNGQQPKPVIGQTDYGWIQENGQVKRPTPALPGVVSKKPTGVAKKVSKKKGAKQMQNNFQLPYPGEFKQQLFSNPPFEDQVTTLDMGSEAGDVDDRGIDNEVFDYAAKADADRKSFLMQQLDLNKDDIHETRATSAGDGSKAVADFSDQVNEDEICRDVDPKTTIPSEVYFNEQLYDSVERPPKTPDAEIVLELVEMIDFSSLVYAKDIEAAYADLEEKSDFNVQCSPDSILQETQQSRVVQQVNIPPPPIPFRQQQQPGNPVPPPVAQPLRGPPPPLYIPPMNPNQQDKKERPKSAKSTKSTKSKKSTKSDKSKKSKKMVQRRQVPKSDFVGQCFEDDIARETGYTDSSNHDVYAVVHKQKPEAPPLPKKTKGHEQVTQAAIPIRPKSPHKVYPKNQDEDDDELVIPDIGLFDMDEEALRHHHIRLKKQDSHSPHHERHDSTGSMSDDPHMTHEAEEKVNAAFASIFRDHSRGGDSSEDELDRPRTPRKFIPPKAPAPPPPPPLPVTQDQLINEPLDNEERDNSPEPVPSTSAIGQNVEPNRLRHDESRKDVPGATDPNVESSGRDIQSDYEHNWGKLTDDTLPHQDY